MHHALRSPRPTRAAAGATTVLAALAAVLMGAGPAHAAPCTLDMLAPDADCSHTVLPAHSNIDDRDLSRINLDHAVMPLLEASDAQFDAAEFDHTDLRGLFGLDTKFRGARFASTQLAPADFVATELIRPDFTKAQFRRVNAHAIEAQQGKFGAVTITASDFRYADLVEASFAEARIQGNTTFARANLDSAVFNGAVFNGVDLTGANLVEANFTGSTLTAVSPLASSSPLRW
ncbi:pentapeptide repeat-containing protein [Rhodococcus cerastii]|nr:pentapeptide repeat-containing protein [Rhodococcus cerastii]